MITKFFFRYAFGYSLLVVGIINILQNDTLHGLLFFVCGVNILLYISDIKELEFALKQEGVKNE